MMQVYYSNPSHLVELFIAIIVVASIFLWLELLQAVHSWSRYSGYAFSFSFIRLFFYQLFDFDSSKE